MVLILCIKEYGHQIHELEVMRACSQGDALGVHAQLPFATKSPQFVTIHGKTGLVRTWG